MNTETVVNDSGIVNVDVEVDGCVQGNDQSKLVQLAELEIPRRHQHHHRRLQLPGRHPLILNLIRVVVNTLQQQRPGMPTGALTASLMAGRMQVRQSLFMMTTVNDSDVIVIAMGHGSVRDNNQGDFVEQVVLLILEVHLGPLHLHHLHRHQNHHHQRHLEVVVGG